MTNPLEIDDLKSLLGIAIEDTSQDSILNLTLQSAWMFITSYCRKKFTVQDYEETQIFSSEQQCYILLTEFPVVAINYLRVDDIELREDTYSLEKASGIITLFPIEEDSYRNFMKIEVSYIAGYEDIKAELPDLYFTGLQLAALRYYSFSHGRLGLKSVNAGGEVINVLDTAEGIPQEVKAVLDIYKRAV